MMLGELWCQTSWAKRVLADGCFTRDAKPRKAAKQFSDTPEVLKSLSQSHPCQFIVTWLVGGAQERDG